MASQALTTEDEARANRIVPEALWREARLGEVLPLKYGKARGTQFGYLRASTATFGSNGSFGVFDRALTSKPTIIVGRKGAAGSVHYSAEPCWPIDTAFFTEGTERTFLPFFRYLLESLQLVQFDRSTAIPSLSRDDYDARIVRFPEELDEQRRIVAEIEKLFTRLEAGVAALKRVRTGLKRYRAAVLKAACEGRLVPTEAELARSKPRSAGSIPRKNAAPDFESGTMLLRRILAERRAKWTGRGIFKESAAPDTTNLQPLPEGWSWATVGQLAEIGSGNTPAKIAEHLRGSGPIAWFKVGDMNRPGNERVMRSAENYLTHASAETLRLGIFPAGTIIFPKRGGAIATNKKRQLDTPAATDLNVMGLTPHGSIYAYFWCWFTSVDLASLSDGSNVPQVNNMDILPLPIPLPPLAEQQRIVAEVERRLSVIEELEAVVSANLQRAGRLRQSILQQAFTGKLTS